jgi:hypothetical protein
MSDKNDKGPFYSFYEGKLKYRLEAEIDLYEQDRESYWSERPFDVLPNITFEQAEEFAKAVFSSSETLLSSDITEFDAHTLEQEIQNINSYHERAMSALQQAIDSAKTPEEIRRLGLELLPKQPPEPEDERSPLRLVWERLYIDTAWEATGKIQEGTSRIFKLYGLVLQTRPSEATQKFLTRLGRCYIWGFDSECVMLCRAVLDTAFRDSVKDEICEKHFGKKHNRYDFTLNNRILAALNDGIIDEKTKKLAIKIKERGVKAIHYQPDITEDVFGTICDTLTVLEKIESKEEGA